MYTQVYVIFNRNFSGFEKKTTTCFPSSIGKTREVAIVCIFLSIYKEVNIMLTCILSLSSTHIKHKTWIRDQVIKTNVRSKRINQSANYAMGFCFLSEQLTKSSRKMNFSDLKENSFSVSFLFNKPNRTDKITTSLCEKKNSITVKAGRII